jgi:hypothetical protein
VVDKDWTMSLWLEPGAKLASAGCDSRLDITLTLCFVGWVGWNAAHIPNPAERQNQTQPCTSRQCWKVINAGNYVEKGPL